MRKALLLLLLNLSIPAIYGQIINSHSIDSLKIIIDQTKDDTTKVKLLANYSFHVVFTVPDQALSFAQQGLLLAKSLDYRKGQVLCNSAAAFTRWLTGDYIEATETFLQSVKQAESIKDTALLSTALDGLVSSYRDQGNHGEAVKYARRGLDLTSNSAYWKVMMGSVYNAMNIPDSALYYLLPVDTTFDMSFYGFALFEVGKAYHKNGQSSNALSNYKKSIEILSRSTNIKDLALAFNGVASLFAERGNLDSCIYYAERGLEITQKLSYKQGAFESYLLLSNAFEPINQAKALQYYKLAMEVKDEVFNTLKQTQAISARFESQLLQIELEKGKLEDQNRLRTITLISIIIIFVAVMLLLYKNVRLKQNAKNKIEKAYSELKSTQKQLFHREKMASLGELTAGIAHEIQNPLNFVNNFSEVNKELLSEMKEEIEKGNLEEAKSLAANVIDNHEKINQHGKRADAIVKGMLQHSRSSSGIKEPTNINTLAEEYLKLAYHGLRAKDKTFNVTLKTDFDERIESINVVSQDIGRVMLNLLNNAFYAVSAKAPIHFGTRADGTFEPVVHVSTKISGDKVLISVKDNGIGIPQKVLEKIFQPFFTTKPTGQGTGLGLSLSYDIVKAHGGEIKVETVEGQFSEFIVLLPKT